MFGFRGPLEARLNKLKASADKLSADAHNEMEKLNLAISNLAEQSKVASDVKAAAKRMNQ